MNVLLNWDYSLDSLLSHHNVARVDVNPTQYATRGNGTTGLPCTHARTRGRDAAVAAAETESVCLMPQLLSLRGNFDVVLSVVGSLAATPLSASFQLIHVDADIAVDAQQPLVDAASALGMVQHSAGGWGILFTRRSAAPERARLRSESRAALRPLVALAPRPPQADALDANIVQVGPPPAVASRLGLLVLFRPPHRTASCDSCTTHPARLSGELVRRLFSASHSEWSLQRFAVSVLQACSPLVTLVLFVSHADMPRLGYLRRARVCRRKAHPQGWRSLARSHRRGERGSVGGRVWKRWHGLGGRLEALGACSGGSDLLRCLPTSLAQE